MVLLCCISYQSYSDTTGLLISPNNWDGSYTLCSGSSCWGGTSGGSSPSFNGSYTFRWGYGGGIVSQSIAIQQALQQSGIQVDGFTYKWEVKNYNAESSQSGVDPFVVTVDVYRADGSLYKTFEWDYSYTISDWTFFEGTETFDPYLSPSFFSDITLSAEGDDIGYWAGWYGPEWRVYNFSLNYSANPCYPDPLVNAACPDYAEAYAAKQLEELLEQVNSPVEETNVEITPTTQSTASTDPIQLGGTEVAGESTTDQERIGTQQEKDSDDDKKQKLDLVRSLDAANSFDVSSVSGAPTADAGLDIAAAAEQQVIGGSLDASMDQTISGLGGLSSNTTTSEQNQQASQTREERQERREKLKELTESRANEIAEENAEAESLDEQAQQQMEQLALMNYVPGFDTYGIALNGGVYPDVAFYKPTTVPESKRGLRNGLAQQLLHEKMIDMQYKGN